MQNLLLKSPFEVRWKVCDRLLYARSSVRIRNPLTFSTRCNLSAAPGPNVAERTPASPSFLMTYERMHSIVPRGAPGNSSAHLIWKPWRAASCARTTRAQIYIRLAIHRQTSITPSKTHLTIIVGGVKVSPMLNVVKWAYTR